MKKIIIAIVATLLVAAIAGGSIFIFTAKESKQITLENIYGFYSVKTEITDFVRGEKDAEFLGIINTYKPSTAKIHIVLTPIGDFTTDSGTATFAFDAPHWTLSDKTDAQISDTAFSITLNPEGVTEVYVDIESDLKISTVSEPENDSTSLTNISGTATYKRFFNDINAK